MRSSFIYDSDLTGVQNVLVLAIDMGYVLGVQGCCDGFDGKPFRLNGLLVLSSVLGIELLLCDVIEQTIMSSIKVNNMGTSIQRQAH